MVANGLKEQLQSVRGLGVERHAASLIWKWPATVREEGRSQIKDPHIHSNCLNLLYASYWLLEM
jgi:hypothetical protein